MLGNSIQNVMTTYSLCEQALDPILSAADMLPIIHHASGASRCVIGMAGSCFAMAATVDNLVRQVFWEVNQDEHTTRMEKSWQLLKNSTADMILGSIIATSGGFLIGIGRAAYHHSEPLAQLKDSILNFVFQRA